MSVLYQHEKRAYHPLEDKVVAISRGGNGIGAAIALELVKQGYRKFTLVIQRVVIRFT